MADALHYISNTYKALNVLFLVCHFILIQLTFRSVDRFDELLVDIVVSQPLLCLYSKLEHCRKLYGGPGAVRTVLGGKYRKLLTQTPGPIPARPGRVVPCNLDRGRCFPWLTGSSRARVLIVTIPGRFRSPGSSVQSPCENPRYPGIGQWGFNMYAWSLWDDSAI